MVSVTHGRPTVISKCHALAIPSPLTTHDSGRNATGVTNEYQKRISFFMKSVELYEIINQIRVTFYSPTRPSHSNDGSGSPIDTSEEDLGSLIGLDKALGKWERSLPEHLRFVRVEEIDNEVFQRQAVILHMR
jgi:hypothetical protein